MRRLLIVALLGVIAVLVSIMVGRIVLTPRRTTPVYDPPVLAGQVIPGFCSAGFYARRRDTIVLTSSDHCANEGMVAVDPGGGGSNGVFGPSDQAATCPYPGYRCAATDMNILVVAPDRIPWGHLNVVDLGTAGYRVIPAGTRALTCDDIHAGDTAEIDGRDTYRSGPVTEKGENHFPVDQDGSYFPCMVAAHVAVGSGDSGGAVLVRGIPAGVISRTFGGWLGFTPLGEGLKEMGLDLCTDPDCGLAPPASAGHEGASASPDG